MQVKNLRARLTSFYQRFAPHKLARVEAIVASFVSRGSSSEALSHLNDEVCCLSLSHCLSLGRCSTDKSFSSLMCYFYSVASNLWERPRFVLSVIFRCAIPAFGGRWKHQRICRAIRCCARCSSVASCASEYLNDSSFLASAIFECAAATATDQRPLVGRGRPISCPNPQCDNISLDTDQLRFAWDAAGCVIIGFQREWHSERWSAATIG